KCQGIPKVATFEPIFKITIIIHHRIENWLRILRQVNHEIQNQIVTYRWL
ncbi:TPA: hypothetical protein G8V35_004457, partial [Salmonella enterica]|nr:hypothetical protein [Salmonella enterica]